MAAKAKVAAKAKQFDSIEEELLDATGEKAQGRKEERGAFLTRVVNAVDGMEDDDYGKLSEEAQGWFESAVKAVNKDKVPADFPDAEGPGEEEGDGEEEQEAAPKKGAKPSAKATLAAKKTAKSAKGAPKGDGYKGHRAGSNAERAHKLIDDMVKQKKDREVIIKAVSKIGIKENTAKHWYGLWA